jgi:EAL domain-containing protein (putative c-di-GMP-specific phosphodiesterase class I)
MRGLLSDNDLVSRTGGDEFSILCTIPDYAVGIEIVGRIHTAFENAFDVQNEKVDIKASIGLAYYPANGDTAETLMQKAELAMHAAKQVSRGYMEYNAELKADSKRRVLLLKDLKAAIEEGDLSLHYQPKIDLKTRSIKAVEALVRWEHPEHGRISPEEFIPLAEQNRLIQPLSYWVTHTAIQQTNDWHRRGINLDMAINISTHDLAGENLPSMIKSMLDEMTIAPEHITLEITESSLMQDQHHARSIIQTLSDLGLHISVDDFGTGYSSLAYLSQLSVDEIKIDQTFVMGMNERAQDATIVKATIDLAHNLGKRVTAEGIEDSEAMQRLCTWNCDTGQGYYFSPPMTASDLETWLRESGWQRKTGV